MGVGDQCRVDARGHAGIGVLHDGEQLDHLVFRGGGGDVVGGDLGDALDGDVVDGDGGVEARVAMMAALLAAS